MTKFTEAEIELIVKLLRDEVPLPKELRGKIVFEDDPEEGHVDIGRQPIHKKLNGLIGNDLARRGLFDQIRAIASSDIPVLVEGEKGTGKRLTARMIHETGSRRNGPFILVDCSSLPEVLSENQLLGQERRAFTGAVAEKEGLVEIAGQGTIVFNEVDALPLSTQVILLQLLEANSIVNLENNEQKAFEARVIATSHRDLKASVREGSFRDDLYVHISAMTLALPPLRERRDDILVLANFFHQKYATVNNMRVMGFSAAALEALWHYKWPGNVTELENGIKGAVVTAGGRKIRPEDLGLGTQVEKIQYAGMNLKKAREIFLRDLILQALSKNGDNITKAAEDLGISRPTLYDLRVKLKISRP